MATRTQNIPVNSLSVAALGAGQRPINAAVARGDVRRGKKKRKGRK